MHAILMKIATDTIANKVFYKKDENLNESFFSFDLMADNFFYRAFRRVKNSRILLDTLIGTAFIFSLILMLHSFRFLGDVSFFDPIGDAIGDVEFTDIVFSELRQDPEVDTSIVLVNIGNLDRRAIARQVRILNACKPALIAIDGYFWSQKEDTLGDILLAEALENTPNLVLASKLNYNAPTGNYDSLACSHPIFMHGDHGYANLETEALEQHQFKVCRSFPPTYAVNGVEQLSFSVRIAERFDAQAAHEFLSRGNETETINYRGNIMDYGQTRYGGRYMALDVDDVLLQRFETGALEGKILLLGYMGDNFEDRSWEDKFFTPLNRKYAGRSNPDMFGVVVHANIVSMILKKDYINRQSDASSYWWALIICFGNVWLFTVIYHRLPNWYDGLTKGIQVLEVILILTFNVVVFHWFGYKTNLTLATIAVALASDGLEVCYGVLLNLFSSVGRQRIFSIHREPKRIRV
jgi:CHASE2 domain-containing sensor protein